VAATGRERCAAWPPGSGGHSLRSTTTASAWSTTILGAPLLPGVESAWPFPHRAHLERQRVEALRLAARTASIQGHHPQAIDFATAAVEADDLDECSHRALIEARVASGDRAGAQRALDDCRRRLDAALGVAPSAATMASADGI
jgi:two-component SAPR family response regulator